MSEELANSRGQVFHAAEQSPCVQASWDLSVESHSPMSPFYVSSFRTAPTYLNKTCFHYSDLSHISEKMFINCHKCQ